jgi:phage terminase large subunit-like protein
MSAALLDLQVLDEIEGAWVNDTDGFLAEPLELSRLTDPQLEYVARPDRRVIWRAANSLGKSYAQAWDIIHTARGTHPFRPVKRPPVDLMVVGYSFAQMDPLCKKLWDLLPKNEIDPKVWYEPANGFRGFKIPVIPFVSGPGAGSNIYFATYEQGAGRIMGIQVDGVYLDEPPPEDIWGEVIPRLNARKGFLRVTFTPTPESPDLEYLRKEVEAGIETKGRRGVVEQQTSIRPENVIPRHAPPHMEAVQARRWEPTPWMSQAEIDEALDAYLEDQRDMREHGAWFPLQKGRWVSTFTEDNIRDGVPPANAFVVVALDHGLNAGKQAATVAAYMDRHAFGLKEVEVEVEDERGKRLVRRSVAHDPRVWFMNESVGSGETGSAEDAQAILEMLSAVGLSYDHVDLWVGDRPTGENRYLVKKSNDILLREIARKLGRRVDDPRMKKIWVPRKFDGSVRAGAALLKSAFKRRDPETGLPVSVVHPRMKQFIDSLYKFKGDPRDPVKDIFDAGRYNLEAATGRDRGLAWAPKIVQ